MHVVSYAEAARIAGVSRQAINALKKRFENGSPKYSCFKHSPEDGLPGIDVDDRTWKEYVDMHNYARIRPPGRTAESVEQEMIGYLVEILEVVAEAVQEVTGATDEQLEEIKLKVASKYA